MFLHILVETCNQFIKVPVVCRLGGYHPYKLHIVQELKKTDFASQIDFWVQFLPDYVVEEW